MQNTNTADDRVEHIRRDKQLDGRGTTVTAEPRHRRTDETFQHDEMKINFLSLSRLCVYLPTYLCTFICPTEKMVARALARARLARKKKPFSCCDRPSLTCWALLPRLAHPGPVSLPVVFRRPSEKLWFLLPRKKQFFRVSKVNTFRVSQSYLVWNYFHLTLVQVLLFLSIGTCRCDGNSGGDGGGLQSLKVSVSEIILQLST